MNNWLGCTVSIHCGNTLGTYQGQISEATANSITLIKAFRNGLPYPKSDVIIKASDIEKLEFIELEPSNTGDTPARSTVTVAKPIPKRLGRSVSASESPKITTKPVEIIQPLSNRKDKPRLRKRDEACFGSPLDASMLQDFDFEKNLALFDKRAVWDELNAAQKPDVVRQTVKYRHDEPVIVPDSVINTLRFYTGTRSGPVIPTGVTAVKEAAGALVYVTDSGLRVSSVSSVTRAALWAACEAHGLGLQRRIELLGRATADTALQLLGGGRRLEPRNAHQAPTVVALVGGHAPGAATLAAARHLVAHGVRTVACMPPSTLLPPSWFNIEKSLFDSTHCTIVSNSIDLPRTPDLILLGLCDETAPGPVPALISSIAEWASCCKAPILAVDPPAVGTLGFIARLSVVPVVPLAHAIENGRLYLCNLGVPVDIFAEVGITYKAPFGPKFVIPLHPSDS